MSSDTATLVTAKELAGMAGVTPKRMRRFIRAQAAKDDAIIGACGAGNRYGITKADASKLVAAFKASKQAPTS